MHQTLRHPVTSEVSYTDEEREFLLAVHTYKHNNKRPYPTWREILAIVHALGYRKVCDITDLPVFRVGYGPGSDT